MCVQNTHGSQTVVQLRKCIKAQIRRCLVETNKKIERNSLLINHEQMKNYTPEGEFWSYIFS